MQQASCSEFDRSASGSSAGTDIVTLVSAASATATAAAVQNQMKIAVDGTRERTRAQTTEASAGRPVAIATDHVRAASSGSAAWSQPGSTRAV